MILSLVATMYFAIQAEDIADPWAGILIALSAISFVGAIVYTATRKKTVGK